MKSNMLNMKLFLGILVVIIGLLISVYIDKRFPLRSNEEISNNRTEIPQIKNSEKVINIFRKGLTYETTNNLENIEPFLELIDHLKESFPKFFSVVEIIGEKEFDNNAIIFKLEGSNPKLQPVILMSHTDVVPAKAEEWTVHPFSGKIEYSDDKAYIYGRGTLDNKINTFSSLQAIEILLDSGYISNRTFFFSITYDEESRSKGARAVLEFFKNIFGSNLENSNNKNNSPFMIFDEGGCLYRNNFESITGDVAMVSLNEKAGSLLNFTISCSETGHVSFSKSDSCIDIIAESVVKLKNFKFPSHSTTDPVITQFIDTIYENTNSWSEFIFFALFRKIALVLDYFFDKKSKVMSSLIRTTHMVSLLNVGKIYNVLPNEGYFVVDVRRFPGDTLEYVKKTFIELIKREGITDISVDVIWSKENHNSAPIDSFQFRAIKSAIIETFGEKQKVTVAPFILPGGTDLQYLKELSDFTFNFTPMIIDNYFDDLSRPHGNNERISVQNYLTAIEFYESLILKLDYVVKEKTNMK